MDDLPEPKQAIRSGLGPPVGCFIDLRWIGPEVDCEGQWTHDNSAKSPRNPRAKEPRYTNFSQNVSGLKASSIAMAFSPK